MQYSCKTFFYLTYVKNNNVCFFNYLIYFQLSGRTFIAAQGPKKSTLKDFWKMIWYEKTKLVIMLTSIKEKGKVCKLIKNKHALLYKYFKTELKFF